MELPERAAENIQDKNGDISKKNFMKFCTDRKLLDYSNIMAIAIGAKSKTQTPYRFIKP